MGTLWPQRLSSALAPIRPSTGSQWSCYRSLIGTFVFLELLFLFPSSPHHALLCAPLSFSFSSAPLSHSLLPSLGFKILLPLTNKGWIYS